MNTLRFVCALVSTAIKASLALRGAFVLQAVLMMVNNLVFFTTWWILFQRFDDLRGYRMPDMLALFGLSTCGYGLGVVTCGGAVELARTITDGKLEGLLSQPKGVLLRAIASRSRASGFGELASGMILLSQSGYVTLARLPLVLLAITIAASMLVCSAILFHSLSFWLTDVESAAESLLHFVVMFTLYPPTLFGPLTKVVLFTLLPAGLIAYLPVELVRSARLDALLWAVGGALAYGLVAVRVFERGLRRYASGSRFSTWG